MAKKQEAEKELAAKNAELQDADTKVVKDTEQIESEADSKLIEDIKSTAWSTPEGDSDWDLDEQMFGNYSDAERAILEEQYAGPFNQTNQRDVIQRLEEPINIIDVLLNVA